MIAACNQRIVCRVKERCCSIGKMRWAAAVVLMMGYRLSPAQQRTMLFI
jgi:hypothetical protein